MHQKTRRIDLPLLAASLFIAFVIWLMAKQGQQRTGVFPSTVEVANIPSYVEMNWEPAEIDVIVKFPESQRMRVGGKNFHIRLDAAEIFGADPLAWAGIGTFQERSVDITRDHVLTRDLPQSVSVVGLDSQSRVRLKSRLFTRKLPVKAQTQGSVSPGFEVAEAIRVDPPEVLVTAPYETLQRVGESTKEILTFPIRLEGRQANFLAHPGLQVPEELKLVNGEMSKKVTVSVSITEKEIAKTVPEVPIRVPVLADALEARSRPPTAEVRVRGKISAVDLIDSGSFSFAVKGGPQEKAGERGQAELIVDLSEKLPRDLRQKVRIESYSPKSVEIEFAPISAKAPRGP